MAAEASIEAKEQRGDDAFFQMVERVQGDIGTGRGVSRANIERHATELGLDAGRFRRALDEHTHSKAVDEDAAAAHAVDIRGTPAFVINGYFVSGAQPLQMFERVVERALSDLRKGGARVKR
jgi:predicted DsbA family dithiol-disulfide isomerase